MNWLSIDMKLLYFVSSVAALSPQQPCFYQDPKWLGTSAFLICIQLLLHNLCG